MSQENLKIVLVVARTLWGGVGGEGIDHGGCKIGWGFFQIRTVVEFRGLCVECVKAICKREWNAK